MEKPKIENYKLGKGFHTQNFVTDLTLYADQVEAEKKELTEVIEALVVLVDTRLTPTESHIWKRIRERAQDLIKQK